MNSTYVLYIVAIVLVILIAYLIAVILRKKNDIKIKELSTSLEQLNGLSLNQAVEDVRRLQLIGHSLENFEDWATKWQHLADETLPKIAGQLEDIQNYNDTFNFIKTKTELEQVTEVLAETESQVEAISEGLTILKDQDAKNVKRVTYVLDQHEALQTAVQALENNLGPCLPEIKKQLATIEAEFSEFVSLNTAGDPVEAAEILDKAEEHTLALDNIIQQLPEVIVETTEKLPEQLDDLEVGYAKLLEDNYQFGDQNIEADFQTIRESITTATDELATLDLDKTRTSNEDCQERIDALYELFEQEIEAHKAVVKNLKILPKFFAHAQENHKQLEEELYRLNQHYILPDSISQLFKALDKDLNKIEIEVLPTTEEGQLPEQPYSLLQDIYGKTISNLKTIEQEQVVLAEQMQAVEEVERQTSELLDEDINRIHTIKRYMDKRQLPGVPEEFVSQFFVVSGQLEALQNELKRNRVDIQTVESMGENIKLAMQDLENQAYEIIQYATLTEQLLQYSNRYRSFEPALQQSFETAFHLFENNLDYRGAFDEISYALEIVEPGVTDRFVNSYEKTKELIRF